MTIENYRDDDDTRDYDKNKQRVAVVPGFPTDRVRWGPIIAGTFAALTMMLVLTALGAAIGLSAFDRGDNARTFGVVGGIFGIITLILCFGFGGWLAGRATAVRGSQNGLLNGFMVAAVGIPMIFFAVASAGLSAGRAALSADESMRQSIEDSYDERAQPAAARLDGQGTSPQGEQKMSSEDADKAKGAARNAAWTSLAGLLLAIGAASVAGLVGARDDTDRRDDHDHDEERYENSRPIIPA